MTTTDETRIAWKSDTEDVKRRIVLSPAMVDELIDQNKTTATVIAEEKPTLLDKIKAWFRKG